MEQPPAFVNTKHQTYVCKLHKAIIGLCQAPRAWYTEFKTFISSIWSVGSQSDSSLFRMHGKNLVIFLLLYSLCGRS